jgi:hypothetical protein
MDYKSVSRAKWKKQHYQAYVTELEARLQAQADRDKDVESHLRAHADRERNQTALIEQLKEEHKSELHQVRESLTGAVKKLRDDRDKLLKVLQEPKERERSPRRGSASMSQAKLSVACRALNTMWLTERDQMLAEKDAQIRELREQVQSLRRGDGPIGEVMVHNWPSASAETKAKLLTVTRPVNKTLKHLEHLLEGCRDVCVWGNMPWFGASTVKNAVDELAEQRRR